MSMGVERVVVRSLPARLRYVNRHDDRPLLRTERELRAARLISRCTAVEGDLLLSNKEGARTSEP